MLIWKRLFRPLKQGLQTLFTKPWEKEKLLATITSAVELRVSRKEVAKLKQKVAALESGRTIPEIIGESKQIQAVFETVDKLKDTDANILILGENGTGKDLFANLLCQTSPRACKPFVCIDLSAIPEQLFESGTVWS